MWRERFSAHNTPSRSPAPQPSSRASLQVDRGSPAPRAPSFSNLSDRSSTSLASSAKPTPNAGPGLKNRVDVAPPADVEDPLTALERLVGSALEKTRTVTGSQRPEKLVTSVDFGGKSLQAFTDVVNVPASAPTAPPTEPSSVEEYQKQKDGYQDLHKNISECDDVLSSVESYLASFQADLGAVSAEIEHLQSRSTTLNARLENRRAAEKLLGPVVGRIALPPAVVRKISEGPVDEAWITALEELQARERALEERKASNEGSDPRAVQDLRPVVAALSDKAVERIRDYFAGRIKSLRLANVHAGAVQTRDFLRFRPLFAYLAKRQPALAEDIVQAYANSMRYYYGSNFSRYRDTLLRMRIETVEQRSALGEDVSPAARPSAAGTSSGLTGGASNPAMQDPFNLGRRIDVLRRPPATALPASVAEEARAPVGLETPFYAYNAALADNACAEYAFLAAFLPAPTFSPARAAKLAEAVLAPACDAGNALTRTLLSTAGLDALGVLLALRLAQGLAFRLQRRRAPVLESYLDAAAIQLWPRFQAVLDAHASSLQRLTASLPTRPGGTTGGAAGAAFAALAGGAAGGSAGNMPSAAPHVATQRFASLLRGVLLLSGDARDGEPTGASVGRLRDAFDAFIARARAAFPSGERGRRERARFAAANYGLVMAVLEDPDVKGGLAEECRAHFEDERAAAV